MRPHTSCTALHALNFCLVLFCPFAFVKLAILPVRCTQNRCAHTVQTHLYMHIRSAVCIHTFFLSCFLASFLPDPSFPALASWHFYRDPCTSPLHISALICPFVHLPSRCCAPCRRSTCTRRGQQAPRTSRRSARPVSWTKRSGNRRWQRTSLAVAVDSLPCSTNQITPRGKPRLWRSTRATHPPTPTTPLLALSTPKAGLLQTLVHLEKGTRYVSYSIVSYLSYRIVSIGYRLV